MANTVFLEAYSTGEDYKNSLTLNLSLESFIAYCIFKSCSPNDSSICLKFVVVDKGDSDKDEFVLHFKDAINFTETAKIPWQVASCLYPVVLYSDTVITGLCAVARHICKYKAAPPSFQEHEEGLLGFRKSCLQAPNEVSIWTKFCEVDIINTVKEVLDEQNIRTLPKNLVRFENHLSKPVRVHNVFKIARDLKKVKLKNVEVETVSKPHKVQTTDSTRMSKPRKWKSNVQKDLEIDSCTNVKDLDVCHQFAEGPFLTLADLLLVPSYHILRQHFGKLMFESKLPLTYKWFSNITQIQELEPLVRIISGLKVKPAIIEDLIVPTAEDVSLYKCDPKRHNPKKRLFTKEDDIEQALCALEEGIELIVDNNEYESGIDWSKIPDGANPTAGHLPDDRMERKSQQLENLALAVLSIAKDGDIIVDFCSGSGHLGILVAHLLPKCIVILLENKEQSLLRARERVHEMGLKNVYLFQCNIDFFIGRFDIGIALHACGIATDLVLDKCLAVNANFVLCPCCYGSLHATDRLLYPRSSKFGCLTIDQYLCIAHAADQTHEDHPLTLRGARCMAAIDSDRARMAEQLGYRVTLTRLKPLSCTPKNNLLIGVR